MRVEVPPGIAMIGSTSTTGLQARDVVTVSIKYYGQGSATICPFVQEDQTFIEYFPKVRELSLCSGSAQGWRTYQWTIPDVPNHDLKGAGIEIVNSNPSHFVFYLGAITWGPGRFDGGTGSVKFAGTASWQIRVSEWGGSLERALWVRAAERIDVPAGGVVTGPPDVDPLPAPSVPSGAALAEGWLFWWRALLSQPDPPVPPTPDDLAEPSRFGPPDFRGLEAYPELRRVAAARWEEANAWHSSRKRSGIDAFRSAAASRGPRPGPGIEFAVVRSVEEELGHKAAPFHLRIIVVPVLDEEIRSVGGATFLVPERVRATEAYTRWLRAAVRAMA